MESMIRYELRNGKFGAYFHDTETDRDLSLETVLQLLNRKVETKKNLRDLLPKRFALATKDFELNRLLLKKLDSIGIFIHGNRYGLDEELDCFNEDHNLHINQNYVSGYDGLYYDEIDISKVIEVTNRVKEK